MCCDQINPDLIVVSGSALGETGPWRGWMGYGPLVRSVSGLTSLWRYPDDEESFSDSTVIHPDHYAARVCAVTTLAALIGRRSVRHAARRSRVSQAETILMQLGSVLAAESWLGNGDGNSEPRAVPWGLYPCAGEDEWCAITVRDDRWLAPSSRRPRRSGVGR